MRELETWRLENDKGKSRPTLSTMTQSMHVRSNILFMGRDNSLFRQDSAFKSDGKIPKIIGINPGQNTYSVRQLAILKAVIQRMKQLKFLT